MTQISRDSKGLNEIGWRTVILMLQHHAKALQLAGVQPRPAAQAAKSIAAIEHRIRRPLPASLREWYSLEGACDLLLRHSNSDPPVALADLGCSDLIARNLLPFRHENQGVCTWAVDLNGSDDPPVLVDYDKNFESPRPCANRFSEHVYASVWDWHCVLTNATIQAQIDPLSDEALDFLGRTFQAELVTEGWPGDTQYRFFSADQRVLIWESKDWADWWLSADNDAALLRLVQTIWEIDNLGGSLWSPDASCAAVLRQAGASIRGNDA